MFNGISVSLISWKPFHSSLLLNYRSKYQIIKYVVNLLGKIFYRFDFFVEAIFTFLFHYRLRKWTNLIHVIGNVNVTSATLIFAKIYNKEIICSAVVYLVVMLYSFFIVLMLFLQWVFLFCSLSSSFCLVVHKRHACIHFAS